MDSKILPTESNVSISPTSVDDGPVEDFPVSWQDSPTKNDIVDTRSKPKNRMITRHYKSFWNADKKTDESYLTS